MHARILDIVVLDLSILLSVVLEESEEVAYCLAVIKLGVGLFSLLEKCHIGQMI